MYVEKFDMRLFVKDAATKGRIIYSFIVKRAV